MASLSNFIAPFAASRTSSWVNQSPGAAGVSKIFQSAAPSCPVSKYFYRGFTSARTRSTLARCMPRRLKNSRLYAACHGPPPDIGILLPRAGGRGDADRREI